MNLQQLFDENLKHVGNIQKVENDPSYTALKDLVGDKQKSGAEFENRVLGLIDELVSSLMKEEERNFSLLFLIYSGVPGLPDEVRSFCLDTMLFSEGDCHGNVTQIGDVKKAWKKIRQNRRL